VSANKGDLVQVHFVALEPAERAGHLPAATRAVPYEGWIKGFLLEDRAEMGQEVRIRTLIGREVAGTLAAINPRYEHGFGDPQPELESIGLEAWNLLEGGQRTQ